MEAFNISGACRPTSRYGAAHPDGLAADGPLGRTAGRGVHSW